LDNQIIIEHIRQNAIPLQSPQDLQNALEPLEFVEQQKAELTFQ
jgi:hypothetical protein